MWCRIDRLFIWEQRAQWEVWVVSRTTLIARFMGPTWGPSESDRTQVGPMWAPWTLLSGKVAPIWTKEPYFLVSWWSSTRKVFCTKSKHNCRWLYEFNRYCLNKLDHNSIHTFNSCTNCFRAVHESYVLFISTIGFPTQHDQHCNKKSITTLFFSFYFKVYSKCHILGTDTKPDNDRSFLYDIILIYKQWYLHQQPLCRKIS